jgi:hypothetical protein
VIEIGGCHRREDLETLARHLDQLVGLEAEEIGEKGAVASDVRAALRPFIERAAMGRPGPSADPSSAADEVGRRRYIVPRL